MKTLAKKPKSKATSKKTTTVLAFEKNPYVLKRIPFNLKGKYEAKIGMKKIMLDVISLERSGDYSYGFQQDMSTFTNFPYLITASSVKSLHEGKAVKLYKGTPKKGHSIGTIKKIKK